MAKRRAVGKVVKRERKSPWKTFWVIVGIVILLIVGLFYIGAFKSLSESPRTFSSGRTPAIPVAPLDRCSTCFEIYQHAVNTCLDNYQFDHDHFGRDYLCTLHACDYDGDGHVYTEELDRCQQDQTAVDSYNQCLIEEYQHCLDVAFTHWVVDCDTSQTPPPDCLR